MAGNFDAEGFNDYTWYFVAAFEYAYICGYKIEIAEMGGHE